MILSNLPVTSLRNPSFAESLEATGATTYPVPTITLPLEDIGFGVVMADDVLLELMEPPPPPLLTLETTGVETYATNEDAAHV